MKKITRVSLTVCLILVIVSGMSASTLAETASQTVIMAEQRFEKANELLNRKEYKAAIAEFEEVMNISPNSRIAQDAQYWMGQSHFMAGQFDAAQATFAKLIEQYPASAIVAATELMADRVGQAKDVEEKRRAIAEARMRLA
ncbi:MAG: tetratricopeptide repeat protein, partial [Planctomycetota bacterium]